MSKNSLYDKNEHLTDFGIEVTDEMAKALYPVLEKYKHLSLIQLQHMFIREMMYQSTFIKLQLQNETTKKTKARKTGAKS